MNDGRTTQIIRFNGREFRRITWKGQPRVTVVWAVREHVNPGVMRATRMSRRVT